MPPANDYAIDANTGAFIPADYGGVLDNMFLWIQALAADQQQQYWSSRAFCSLFTSIFHLLSSFSGDTESLLS